MDAQAPNRLTPHREAEQAPVPTKPPRRCHHQQQTPPRPKHPSTRPTPSWMPIWAAPLVLFPGWHRSNLGVEFTHAE